MGNQSLNPVCPKCNNRHSACAECYKEDKCDICGRTYQFRLDAVVAVPYNCPKCRLIIRRKQNNIGK